MKRISLCSFTYNDGELLHGLLAEIPLWPRLPDEIVLVDDGSSAPFALTGEEKKLPVRLLRLPRNRGFREAKHTGVSAATGDVIIAMDCDGRLQGDFLTNAEKMLADPATGLVGIADARQAEGDLLSSYLNVFEVERRLEEMEETEFLAGGAFAVRRELWEEIGGFSGYTGNLAEDYYLSATLRGRGYKLRLERESRLRFVRRLTRDVFCRRLWKCYEESWMAALKPDKPFSDRVSLPLLVARQHCALISGRHPPVWIYFELLLACHICLMFCNTLGRAGAVPRNAGADLTRIMAARLSGRPMLYRLLKADLMRSGALPLAEAKAPRPEDRSPLATRCDWSVFSSFLGSLEEGLALEYLDKRGVQEILAEEAALKTDFSSY